MNLKSKRITLFKIIKHCCQCYVTAWCLIVPAFGHANTVSFENYNQRIQQTNDTQLIAKLLSQANSEYSQYSLIEKGQFFLASGQLKYTERQLSEAVDLVSSGIALFVDEPPKNHSILVELLLSRALIISNMDQNSSMICDDRRRALENARLIKEDAWIGRSIAYYARCAHSEENDLQRSFQLFEEAFAIAERMEFDSETLQIIYNQAATLHYRALMYRKAYDYNQIAYQNFVKGNDISSIYNTLVNAIHYSLALADPLLVDKHLSELLNWASENPSTQDAMQKYYYLSAKKAMLTNDWPQAVDFLKSGVTASGNSLNVSYTQATYELLSVAYFRVGKTEESIAMLEQARRLFPDKRPIRKEVKLLASLNSGESVELIQNALILIDKEKQNKDRFVKQSTVNQALIFENKMQKLDQVIAKQKLTLIISVCVFLLLLLLGYTYLQWQKRKLAQKEYQLTDDLLTKKNQLLAVIAHELNTPLTVLKLQVESLKDQLETDLVASYDAMDRKLVDVENLINDIHQLAQSDIGTLSLNKSTFEVNETLSQWHEELATFINYKKIHFEAEQLLPPNLIVSLDKERIKQVFTNLLSNSLKYTDKPGLIKLRATLHRSTLVLSVEDSAPGVSNDDLQNIFERLYRVESSRSRDTGGSGLGLSICKSLVEAHGGTIIAEHSDLGGIKITIKLPVS